MRFHQLFVGAVAALLASCLSSAAAGILINDNNVHIDRGVLYSNLSFLTASGGTAPYSFVVNSGLPPGVVVNSAGQVSGATCGSNGSFGLSVTVTDNVGGTATASNKALIVNAAPAGGCNLTFTSSAPTSTASVGQPYSFSFAISGGSGSATYSVGSGSVPTGLSLSSSGTLSGTPTVQGSYTFSIWAVDGSNTGSSANYTITVGAAPAGAPTVSSLSPTSGPATGGTTVTVSGTNFTGTTGVSFGGVAGTSVNVVSATSLTVVTPAKATGAVTVAVVNGSGTGSLVNAYTYVQASQTITFTNPGAQNYGTTPTLTATSSSGLTVAFTSATTSVCTITSGGALTFVTAGTCTINANQGGNTTYAAASQVQQSFSVNAVVPGAPTIGTATAGDAQASVGFTAPASTGGASITGYTVTSSPGGFTGTGTSSPIIVAGLTNGTAYTFTVTATNSAGTGSTSAASNAVTPRGSQTITFANPGAQNFGATPTLTATSDSGLTVSFASSTTGVCTITSGGALTFVTAGTCTVSADQAGNGTYLAATTVQRSFTVNAVAPDAPTIGTATAGDTEVIVTFTAPSDTGGASITGYTVTSNPGGLTGTGTSSPIIVAGLTNGTPYTFTVTATNGAGTGNASAPSNQVTPNAAQAAPIAGAGSATVAANSTSNQITLNLSGDAAASVAVGTGANHGTATASGISITYTPTAGYSGSDSFTYTATNAIGTSSPATVTITVSAPTLALNPSAGALPDGTVGSSYSETITASAGTGPYSYALTGGALPPGVNLDPSTGTISGTPTVNADYSFTITATDDYGAQGSVSFTLKINPPAALTLSPSAGALPDGTVGSSYSETVTASSGSVPYSFAVTSGALPSGVSLDPSIGTITGTPTTDGDYSFTVTATDVYGAQGSVSFTLKINPLPALVLNPSSGALPDGTVGSSYSETVTASSGTGPYSFAITSGALPSGVSLDPATGAISGTPTADGNNSFTLTASDSLGAQGSVSLTLKVNPAAVSLVFTPSGGALPPAMAGEDYNQSISANGGNGSLLYSLASGSLPQGMILNVSTGALSGPLDANATVGDYSFTLQASDGNGGTATASFTLHVNARAVAVTDKVVNVPAGDAPLNVDLTQGATGGPFTTGELVEVSPSNAGTVSIVNGEFAQVGPIGNLGWYLKFIPNPTYKGQVSVTFRLTSTLGVSNLGVVYYNVAYDPGEVATNIDTLVHGFVQTRQNLIATTVAVPGLLERRRMAEARVPVTGRVTPSEDGITTTFSTSLTQMQAAKAHADGMTAPPPSAFNVWMNGTLMLHDREENGGNWGSFAMLSAGADYLLSEHALVGISLHYDRMSDPTDEDATLSGNGWLAGPYGSFEVADGIYWDTSLLYGGSSNTIDTNFWDGKFDTSRWMVDTAVKGEVPLWDGKLTPKLRAVYFSETVKDYSVSNGDGDVMELRGFTTDQLRVSVGAEYTRKIVLDDGSILTPRFGATAGFSGLDGSGAFGTVTAGLTYSPTDNWDVDLGLLVGVEGDGQTSAGAKVGVTGRF